MSSGRDMAAVLYKLTAAKVPYTGPVQGQANKINLIFQQRTLIRLKISRESKTLLGGFLLGIVNSLVMSL